ncbi:inositol monophosphatase family protein [Ornithinimicrobium tianjinense]|uniref:Inositol-1-monophosphatase n=1 Tax=Ornithinimicrobium tianjinense TaxID=1195761 RepID=A0A917BHH8_9MICO|nr:inositol monophosphatase family protein [Ornithinimicrobium tianjinense]GGF45876.1 putative inositol-1-monophosphatase SuhB [Ornithinimicrobium tianjinense]
MVRGDDASTSDETLRELEQLAVAVAEEAGALVRDERPDRTVVDRTKSTDLDIVTVMDTRSEQLIRSRLASARPDDGVLGEEEGLVSGRSGLTWVVDPIDGTVNYLYGLPGYAVSVAVVTGDPTRPGAWEPVACAVVNPSTGETFHARAGGGAHVTAAGPWATGGERARHTRRLEVSTATDLGSLLVATGFAYDRAVREGQAATVAALLPRVRDVRRLGAAALDLAHVAAGRVDAYYERGVKAWDIAAGILLVTEAGGVVSGARPDLPPSPSLTVAGGRGAHATLLAELAVA